MPVYSYKDSESEYYPEKISTTDEVIKLIGSLAQARQRRRQEELSNVIREAMLREMGYEYKDRGGLLGAILGKKLVRTRRPEGLNKSGEGFVFDPSYDPDTGEFKVGLKYSRLTPYQERLISEKESKKEALKDILKSKLEKYGEKSIRDFFSGGGVLDNPDLFSHVIHHGIRIEDILGEEPEISDEERQYAVDFLKSKGYPATEANIRHFLKNRKS